MMYKRLQVFLSIFKDLTKSKKKAWFSNSGKNNKSADLLSVKSD